MQEQKSPSYSQSIVCAFQIGFPPVTIIQLPLGEYTLSVSLPGVQKQQQPLCASPCLTHSYIPSEC